MQGERSLVTGGAILHFAALSLVSESIRQPERYMRENGAGGIRFVLSSTANLFGEPERTRVRPDCGAERLDATACGAGRHRAHSG